MTCIYNQKMLNCSISAKFLLNSCHIPLFFSNSNFHLCHVSTQFFPVVLVSTDQIFLRMGTFREAYSDSECIEKYWNI